jgi:hypothetical protein
MQHLDLRLRLCLQSFVNMGPGVLLYGCKIWGLGNLDMIEKMH